MRLPRKALFQPHAPALGVRSLICSNANRSKGQPSMARLKHIDTAARILAVDLDRQLVSGTFEHSLHELIEHELDMTRFYTRCPARQ